MQPLGGAAYIFIIYTYIQLVICIRLWENPLQKEYFLELAALAIDDLPLKVRKRMNNVEVVVEDYPNPHLCRKLGLSSGRLLGAYQGVPLNKRGPGYGFVLPDKITLFQKPIESICQTREEIIKQIRSTLIHEIGHHFGLNEAQIRKITRGK